ISLLFVTASATTDISTLSLHDALPICQARAMISGPMPATSPIVNKSRGRSFMARSLFRSEWRGPKRKGGGKTKAAAGQQPPGRPERKSQRLNPSHVAKSNDVFTSKQKK